MVGILKSHWELLLGRFPSLWQLCKIVKYTKQPQQLPQLLIPMPWGLRLLGVIRSGKTGYLS